MALKQNRKHN